MPLRDNPQGGAARRAAFCGMLGALALALSALEGALPPLPALPPGAKLGLSNLATMYAAGALGLGPALLLALTKALFAGMTRGAVAFAMSLSGGALSTLAMWILLRPRRRPFGFLGLGVCGALAHNAGQLCTAVFLAGPAAAGYAPWLLLFGVPSGILTGLLLRALYPLLEKLRTRP